MENTPENGKKWIDLVGKEVGVEMVYSEGLQLKLFNRFSNLQASLRKKSGSATRQALLSRKWSIPLEVATRSSDEENIPPPLPDHDVSVPSSSAGKRRHKSYEDCSVSQKRRLKMGLTRDCQPLVSSCFGDGYTGMSMTIWNAKECRREVITFPQQDGVEHGDEELASMALLVKDRHGISGKQIVCNACI